MPAKVQLTIRGTRRSVQIDALIDTGFAGSLCLPMDVASRIGADIHNWGRMQLADGSEVKVPLVICDVELLEVTSPVAAFVTDTFDPLIGTELLEHCQLTIDFDSGAVQLRRTTT